MARRPLSLRRRGAARRPVAAARRWWCIARLRLCALGAEQEIQKRHMKAVPGRLGLGRAAAAGEAHQRHGQDDEKPAAAQGRTTSKP
jgi:hypothetical protein